MTSNGLTLGEPVHLHLSGAARREVEDQVKPCGKIHLGPENKFANSKKKSTCRSPSVEYFGPWIEGNNGSAQTNRGF
jgi:hypothetical protein